MTPIRAAQRRLEGNGRQAAVLVGRDAAEVGTTFTERTHFPGASTRLEAFRLDQWIPQIHPNHRGRKQAREIQR